VSARTSIIIPCYNYGRFLAESIESALEQTQPALEILVVDDGSTDDSLVVARRYADRGVRVLTQPNRGAIATFNTGIRASRGEYFLVLSADDRLDSRYLERVQPLLDADRGAGYVYTAYRLFGTQHRVLGAPSFSFNRLKLRPYIIATVLMRRAAFDQTDGFSPAMAGGHEDWEFFITLAEKGWFGVALPEVLFQYRKHSDTSRNAVSMTHWLDVHRRIYRDHRPLYRLPLRLYLAEVVLNQQWLRLRAAPRAVARRFGPRPGAATPARVVFMVAARSSVPDRSVLLALRQNGITVDVVMPVHEASGRSAAPTGIIDRLVAPLSSRAPALGWAVSITGMTIRATRLRGGVYHSRGTMALLSAFVAASVNRAALVYEPDTSGRSERRAALPRFARSLLERFLCLRTDVLVLAQGSVAPDRCPLPPLVLDTSAESPVEPNVATASPSVDQLRLTRLYHDLLNLR
jgi:glycosyltransferase involved in cell wall biosynthesis